jgi:hypothetical protein
MMIVLTSSAFHGQIGFDELGRERWARPEKEWPFGRDIAGGVSCVTLSGTRFLALPIPEREIRREPHARSIVQSWATQGLDKSEQNGHKAHDLLVPDQHAPLHILIVAAILSRLFRCRQQEVCGSKIPPASRIGNWWLVAFSIDLLINANSRR